VCLLQQSCCARIAKIISTKDDPSSPQSECYLAQCLGSQRSTRTDTPRFPAATVCNWVCLDLCLVCFGGPSLITCQAKGCDCPPHHMCQAEWESANEGRKVHGSRKLCPHHHPACLVDRPSRAAFSSPPAATLGSSQSTMSTLTTTVASVPHRYKRSIRTDTP
jgi:hypothetical protein